MDKRSHRRTQVAEVAKPASGGNEPQVDVNSAPGHTTNNAGQLRERLVSPPDFPLLRSQAAYKEDAATIMSSTLQAPTSLPLADVEARKPSVLVPATSEQGQSYLTPMIANTTDAILAIDQDFIVLDFNPAVTTMLGWTAENALGYPCSEVLKCRNLNHMLLCGTSSCPLVRVLSEKKPLVREELIVGAIAAQSCEVATSVTPIDMERDPYVVFTARDISALKMLNHMRSNFVSMVSHELRTPLNSVHGFIDLLMQGHMGELTEEQHKYLGYAQEGVQQLISIAEDILLMTRSDLGQFEIKAEEVNFRVLAKQVVSSLQPQALKADVVINKDIPSPSPLLYVDPQRMKQVLNNLVTNAIKFTPPGGTVTISARPFDQRFVLISVTDTGFGIAAEDRQHVFERFYQSNHSQQSKMGGYGLGLPIARLIVEQHGGEIDFDTEPDRGTTFYFTAPLYRGQ